MVDKTYGEWKEPNAVGDADSQKKNLQDAKALITPSLVGTSGTQWTCWELRSIATCRASRHWCCHHWPEIGFDDEKHIKKKTNFHQVTELLQWALPSPSSHPLQSIPATSRPSQVEQSNHRYPPLPFQDLDRFNQSKGLFYQNNVVGNIRISFVKIRLLSENLKFSNLNLRVTDGGLKFRNLNLRVTNRGLKFSNLNLRVTYRGLKISNLNLRVTNGGLKFII